MRITRTVLAVLLVLTALTAVVAGEGVAPASASTPYCGIRWGSLEKSSAPMTTAPVVNVRAGRHACFDRLVIDLGGRRVAGYDVRYVSAVYSDPKGDLVPLRGGAFLQVVIRAPAYDVETGRSTYWKAGWANLVNVTYFRTFRQVAWAGSFEGLTTIGLGVRARLPFRVFTLVGPYSSSRVVIDVAHRW